MDSYYAFHDDAHCFYGAPASPDLPFADLIASLSSTEPPPAVAADAVARQSAFQQYYCRAAGAERGGGGENNGGKVNIHRRVVDVLGRMGTAGESAAEQEQRRQHQQEQEQEAGAIESSRGFRHMMRERQRREKLSQSYADLYAMVSSRSKGDKNSIVQSAAIYIHELKCAKDQLQRKNEELKAKILGHDAQQQCVKVQFEVDEPSSSIDSMIGALRRLKSMNVKTRGIRSKLSGQTLTTEMNVETTIAASEVEKAVEEALKEVERKQPDSDVPFPGNRGWSQPSHVQNVF